LSRSGPKRYGVGMDRATGHPTAECIEIDHPWISNDLMPIYRWTFPSEATDEAPSRPLPTQRPAGRGKKALRGKNCVVEPHGRRPGG
jgi:hypothetical protein